MTLRTIFITTALFLCITAVIAFGIFITWFLLNANVEAEEFSRASF